jgi:UDP-N-acetylglucosamine 2-epimerase (non-hydrolysing)
MTLKILTLIGTRPELIKLAPVIKCLEKRKDTFSSVVCFTGQHREMLDQAALVFGIKPDIDLNLMLPGQNLSQLTSRAIEAIHSVLEQNKPDIVLVQGDTTTAFCGALTAYYHQIQVGHVEAGLRTHNKYAPFPEEINRCLIGQLADYHFAPTENARQALLQENINSEHIYVTGNTVIDALLWMRDKLKTYRPKLPEKLLNEIEGKRIILVTGHRRENFGEGFENICKAILDVANQNPDVVFVYPVHLNPNVQDPVKRILGGRPNIWLIAPLDYPDLVWLMDRSYLVLTDSGGIQEEAPALGKPVLVMRETTERPEGIEAGNARLVGTDYHKIVDNLTELLNKSEACEAMARVRNPYGDGRAAERIVDVLLEKDFNYS